MARVLAIEDEPTILKGIRRTLERAGHSVQTAQTADAARALIAAISFDVALVDYQLQGDTDGIDLLRVLQEVQPRCARVLVTGHLDLPLAVDAVNQGEIHHVVRKPFRSIDLLNAVEQSVEGYLRRAASLSGEAEASGDERRMLEECLGSQRFRLALQPIVDTEAGTAVGYEGLIRTDHPVFDGPLSLLRMAQRNHMLPEVGTAVAARAVRWMRGMPPGPGLFINVHHDEFADVGALLSRLSGLDPWRERVVLEITGAALERWPGTFSTKIRTVRDSGYTIAIDDLGSGRGALNLLAETAPAYIKTDIDIVRDIDRSPRKRRVVDLLSKFAVATGARLVAEGVETEAEKHTLNDCGVTLMQGFLLGRPGFAAPGAAGTPSPSQPPQAEA